MLLCEAFNFPICDLSMSGPRVVWTRNSETQDNQGWVVGYSSVVAGVTSTVAADQPGRNIWFSKVRCISSLKLLCKSVSENDPISYFSRKDAYFYEGNRSPSLGDFQKYSKLMEILLFCPSYNGKFYARHGVFWINVQQVLRRTGRLLACLVN